MASTFEPRPRIPQRLAERRVARAVAAKASDFLPLCDFASLLLAGYFSFSAYAAFAATATALSEVRDALHWLVWITAIIAPFVLYQQRFAEHARAADHKALVRGFVRRLLVFLVVVYTIVHAGHWLEYLPHRWLALWFAAAMLFTVGSRVWLALYLRRLALRGVLTEVVAVVGTGALADRLIPRLRESAMLYGVFDDPEGQAEICVYPPDSTVDALAVRALSLRPDRIFIALPAAAAGRLPSIVERLRPLGIPLELCPQDLDFRLPSRTVGYIGDELPVSVLADRPIKRWNAVFKASMDFAFALVLAVLLLPLLALIALAIKLDSPGPVLFRQRRHGYNNCEFDIYKFRTMRCAREDAAEASGAVLKQTVRGDPRITRTGTFLRKWSLDELPQLFNVLEGSMSLVGPRPHAVNMRTEARLGEEISPIYPHRHRVKPGITGWSQINGLRGATDTVEQLRRRVELDIHYVENWSPLLDMKILTLTFKEVIRATNAY